MHSSNPNASNEFVISLERWSGLKGNQEGKNDGSPKQVQKHKIGEISFKPDRPCETEYNLPHIRHIACETRFAIAIFP